MSGINSNLPKNPNADITFNELSLKEIYLAGGCFWGVQAYFSRILGVAKTQAGYANGKTERTTYEEVKKTGHAETVRVSYDPNRVSLQTILEHFFALIDPTSIDRQGPDRGAQYRSGIYYTDEADKQVILEVIEKEQKEYKDPIVTDVEALKNFIAAEDYHQDYLEKNPDGYCHIGFSGLEKQPKYVDPALYQKPEEKKIKEELSDMQYKVTQESFTEAPFQNEFWDNHKKGIYVDITTGEPLFLSSDQFDSGCGWPSFSRPIDEEVKIELPDDSIVGRHRTEVRSRVGDAHLGHVFTDGPKDKGGLRYCINSAALRFIPVEEMEKEGYGAFIPLVK